MRLDLRERVVPLCDFRSSKFPVAEAEGEIRGRWSRRSLKAGPWRWGSDSYHIRKTKISRFMAEKATST